MTSSDVNIIFEEEPVEITLSEEPVEIEMPAGQNGQSIHPRGEWSSSEGYGYLDLVSYQGSSYVATKTVPTGTLPTDTGFWMLSAEKGLDGASEWGDITGDIANQTDLAQALAGKANVGDSYTKAETDTLLADKADAADVYTKDETDALLQNKAPVILNSASGSIASFTDGSALPMENLSVAIDPVQDLHGYDAPWPAGGGKNRLNVTATTKTVNEVTFTVYPDGTINVNGTATSVVTFNISDAKFVADSPSGTYVLNGCPSGGSNSTYRMSIAGATGSDIGNGVNVIYSETITNTTVRIIIASGYTANNLLFKPMIRLASESDATFAPYSNICPISGWTSATVTRTRKNLLKQLVKSPVTVAGITFTQNPDGSITANGTSTNNANYQIAGAEELKPLIGKNLYFTGKPEGASGNVYLALYDTNYAGPSLIKGDTGSPITVRAEHTRLLCHINPNQTLNNAVFHPMFTVDPPTTFEPYDGTSVTIDLDGTRYGGTLDVTTGEMTVNKVSLTFDGSEDESWSFVPASRQYAAILVSLPMKYTTSSAIPPMIANIAKPIPQSSSYAEVTYSALSANTQNKRQLRYLYAGVTDTLTLAEFKLWLGENNLQICYELETPVTIQLTPSQMQTLLGENHIWADTGDVSVTYRADSKLYIDGKVAQTAKVTRQMIADSATADGKAPKSLATGDLIIVGDELRKATANIGNGSAITASNSTIATLADVIKALQ